MQRNGDQSTGVSEGGRIVQTQQETESPRQVSAPESLPSLPNHFPASVISRSPRFVVTSPTTSTPNSSPPPRPTALPEGPPSRSPLPPEWQYSEPSRDSSARTSLLITSATSSPLHSPVAEHPVITPNPSYSAVLEGSSLTSRRSLLPGLTSLGGNRSRSPLLGIAALSTLASRASQLSLDWDDYASSPTYFRRTIPVLSTPSTSLDSSPERLGTPVSVIMTIKRCSKCHLYITGAPTPDLQHAGKYGPDCQSGHHPNPCNYSHRDTGACTEYSSSVDPQSSDSQAKFEEQVSARLATPGVASDVNQSMIQDNQQLILDMNRVDTTMRMFPTELMTVDRLSSYEQELKEIRNLFLEFSTKIVTYAMNYANEQSAPKSSDGSLMNVRFWETKEQEMGLKMTNHQILIRKCASDLQSNKSMTEFR